MRGNGLVVRTVVTLLLLAVVYGAAVWLVVLAFSLRDSTGERPWAVLALLAAGVVTMGVQLWMARGGLLRSIRAREVGREKEPELHAVVDRLCALADVPKPRVMVARLEVPNAFATGRTLCVTRGLLRRLSPAELEAVVAHELAHLGHKDRVVLEMAAALGLAFEGVVVLFNKLAELDGSPGMAKVALWFALWPILLFCRTVYVLSSLLVLLLSRAREYAADHAASALTGRPSTLAAALTELSDEMGRIPRRDLRRVAPYEALMCIEMPGGRTRLTRLISAHPPLRKRIDRLAALSGKPPAAG